MGPMGSQIRIRSTNLIRAYSGLVALLSLFMMPVAEAAQSEYAFLSPSVLQHNQRAIAQNNEKGQEQSPVATQQAYRQLLQQADKILKQPNPSVMDKNRVPPSGSKHDYLSLSAYWWPDSQFTLDTQRRAD